MRNPKRIRPFLEELEKLWNRVPDWRFGQLVENVYYNSRSRTDQFYIEDDQFLEMIRDMAGELDSCDPHKV